MQCYEQCQSSSSTTSVAHIGNSFTCLSQSTSLGPWVLDFTAIDHIFGDKALLFGLSPFSYLPTVTFPNGSKTQSHGVGTAYPLPSLSVNSVLYVPDSPSNLLSVSHLPHSFNCIVSFIKDFVFLQDRSSGQTIGIGCESNGLYWLSYPSHACSLFTDPLTIHA